MRDFFTAKTAGVRPVVCLFIANSVDIALPRDLGSVGRYTTERFRPADLSVGRGG